MKKRNAFFLICFVCSCCLSLGYTQDITTFDPNADGPWNDPEETTIVVPKVPLGSVQLDAEPSDAEYGGFEGKTIIPMEHGWILNWPDTRQWDGEEDSTFTFWFAHDDENLYVGVDVIDDVVNQDQTDPAQFWADDSLELVIDPAFWQLDAGFNGEAFDYGGHMYFTCNGKFSHVTEDTYERFRDEEIFATEVDWTFGPDGDIWAVGEETDQGWALEARINKRVFEDPEAEAPWGETKEIIFDNEYEAGYQIAVDEDDQHADRDDGFELQYWFPVTKKLQGFTPEDAAIWTPEEIANDDHIEGPYAYDIVPGERLNYGSLGTMIFSSEITDVGEWMLQ